MTPTPSRRTHAPPVPADVARLAARRLAARLNLWLPYPRRPPPVPHH